MSVASVVAAPRNPRASRARAAAAQARALLAAVVSVLLVAGVALTAVLLPVPARAAGDPSWLVGVARFDPTEATVYLAHGVPNSASASDTQLVEQRQTASTFVPVGTPAG